jgi:hypothetical protein
MLRTLRVTRLFSQSWITDIASLAAIYEVFDCALRWLSAFLVRSCHLGVILPWPEDTYARHFEGCAFCHPGRLPEYS